MKNTFVFSFLLCLLAVFTLCFADSSVAKSKKAIPNENLLIFEAQSNFDDLYTKVMDFLKEKNLTVFAEFDHAKNAEETNLKLKPNKVIVFGNPAVGTKLMQINAQLGLALPLKVLLLENEDGKAQIVIQRLSKVFAMYGMHNNEIVTRMERLLLTLAQEVTK